MDNIYNPKKYPCTENVNLTNYFKDYRKELSSVDEKCVIEDLMKELTDDQITRLKLDELKEITREVLPNTESMPPKYVKKNSKKKKIDVKDKKKESKFRFASFKKITYKPSDNVEVKEEDGSEFLVNVMVFFPRAYNFVSPSMNRSKNLRPSQEIVLLGSNTLTDLRDKILCTNDVGCSINIDSIHKSDLKPKELYPSGLIFIDNTFYNDFRNENAIDYSEVIIKWGESRNMTDFKKAKMEETKIKDLSPRLGYPYVYQHQGKCEHTFIFTNARLTMKSDLYFSYPLYSRLCAVSGRYCDICRKNIATFLCMESVRLPHDQMYLCKVCFRSYNYVDGEKLDNFKAYHYFDKTLIL